MFAIAALLCFVLALFNVTLGEIDLMLLGLALIALHLAVNIPVPFRWSRS